jgi:hypothetical protein
MLLIKAISSVILNFKMNFEQLLKNEKLKIKNISQNCEKFKKKKLKKFFEFQIDNVTFYDLTLFQNINIKIINVPFQDKTLSLSDFNSQKSIEYSDIFILLIMFTLLYFFIVEFISIWYKENISSTGLNLNNYDDLTDKILSTLFTDDTFCKKLSKVNIFFNSNILDFLNMNSYLP